MKIKSKPVTNSSSTSFIVRNRQPIEIVKDMLKIQFNYNREWVSSRPLSEIEYFNEREKRVTNWIADNKDFKENICIPWTTNYETFIYRDWFERCVVFTCNNIGWFNDDDFQADIYLGETTNDDLYEYSYEQIYLDLNDFKLKTRLDIEMEFWIEHATTPEEAEDTRQMTYGQYLEFDKIAQKKLEKMNENKK